MNLLETISRRAVSMAPQKTMSEIVEAIHHDFDTAPDRLVRYANDILAQSVDDQVESEVDRLVKAGFTSHPLIKQHTHRQAEKVALAQKQREAKSLLERIAYYQQHYPFQRFITEKQVGIICAKYGLVDAVVSRYKGTIPDKNLRDIERFQLKAADYSEAEQEKAQYLRKTGLVGPSTLSATDPHWEIPYFGLVRKPRNLMTMHERILDDMRIARGGNTVVPSGYGSNPNDSAHIYDSPDGLPYKYRSELRICAPMEDIRLDAREHILDGKIVSLRYNEKIVDGKIVVFDPVVTQPVANGRLILTAWGLEASDELVANSVFN